MIAAHTGPLAGQVAVVTGGTSGIGFEVCRGLAARGATTVVVGRGAERAAAAAKRISTETGNPSVTSVAVTDLAVLGEVRHLAEALAKDHPKIHILVNNAGQFLHDRQVTSEGHERTFALNVLSPFLLTSELVPTLVESAPARVVNIASDAHRGYTIDFARLENPEPYHSGWRAYGTSKLEVILLSRELARRLTGSGVTVNAVHPGFVHSGFGQNNGGLMAGVIWFGGLLFGHSVRGGADTPLFVATDPSVAHVTGQYFSGRRVRAGSKPSQDLATARELYARCREITAAPEIPQPESSATGGA